MLNAIFGVKLYTQCYTRSEAISSLLYMERSFMPIAIVGVKPFLIVIHGLRLFARSFTRSYQFMLIAIPGVKRNSRCEALCSLLYME